jgi:hypothetical protein
MGGQHDVAATCILVHRPVRGGSELLAVVTANFPLFLLVSPRDAEII